MSNRVQINIRSDEDEKNRYQAAAKADETTPDLSSWIRKHCDAAYSRYLKKLAKEQEKK